MHQRSAIVSSCHFLIYSRDARRNVLQNHEMTRDARIRILTYSTAGKKKKISFNKYRYRTYDNLYVRHDSRVEFTDADPFDVERNHRLDIV